LKCLPVNGCIQYAEVKMSKDLLILLAASVSYSLESIIGIQELSEMRRPDKGRSALFKWVILVPHPVDRDSQEFNHFIMLSASRHIPSHNGHHGPHISHADSKEPSPSQRAPPRHLATLSERTDQDSHAFLLRSPVFPRYRRQHHLNPSDINKQSCTRIGKPQNLSRGHTCRRSGSNLSYIGIDATGLQKY
jgi:hypothetical protein